MSQSPQLGYNHNIPHRGRLYHVQTEDSGLEKQHIFTHVFYDGTIIASNKVEYDAKADVPDLDQFVIGLMQDSHKSMIRNLRRCEYDEKIAKYIGAHPEPAPTKGRAPAAAPTPEPQAEVAEEKAPERRAPPEPRDVEPQGPPLSPGAGGPTVDPSISHPVFASKQAQAQVAAAASTGTPARPSRGPGRVRRRALGGIGGKGAAEGSAVAQRRDIIVGKFASEHQAALDEEILALLREE
jgi:hypothetical protein